MKKNKSAVVLLSGGLDSTVTCYYAKSLGYKVFALNFDYSQRHKVELKKAKLIARKLNIPFTLVKVDFPWKNSALLNKAIALPKNRNIKNIPKEIPITYVPARNIIFLSIAMGFAESIEADAIFIGANALDYSGYPDCRPKFFKAMARALSLGTKMGLKKNIRILTPLIDLSKADIVRMGIKLNVPFGMTWSCYSGGKSPCRKCDSCLLREKGFSEAGIKDPLN